MRRIMIPAAALAIAITTLHVRQNAEAATAIELDEAKVHMEWHATDDEYGIHFFWDGEPWKAMKVLDTRKKPTLIVRNRKAVKAQGLTEAKFESEALESNELSLEEFFDRHPAGTYRFAGRCIEGDALVGEATFSHALPAPATNVSPSRNDTVSRLGFTASFDSVAEDTDGNPIDVDFYELTVEKDEDVPILQTFNVILRPGQTSCFIPEAFLEPDTEYKIEVIVQDRASGNRTIVETGKFTTDN